ncbi:YXWGXW repeat-containing protein [Pseudoroseomonas cervicalis]|uniref:YXWGXW repeat-containing protein n=1 Tax=Teichococcus cervicalis TaxID=204525 RepID=UPI0035EC3362
MARRRARRAAGARRRRRRRAMSAPAPPRGAVWQPGHWGWLRGQYVWVPGRWVEGRRGRWREGRWSSGAAAGSGSSRLAVMPCAA